MGIQVTELTNGKACHEKEFIDFEFAGRHISEFGMVAVADGGRHSFDAAPTFEDETSTVNGVDGQYFWGTHFRSKRMTFSLATDGMTEAQVNDFKHHFQPGKYGKFIEDKLTCRYNYARVSQITTFNMVPFRIQKKIKDTTIYINEYKGDCRITFEFDNPFFETTINLITDINNEDQLRAMYINNIPAGICWEYSTSCLVGDNSKMLKQSAIIDVSSEDNKGKTNLLFYNPSTAKTKSKIEIEIQPTFSSNFPIYFTDIYDDINNNAAPYNQICVTNSINTRDLSDVDYSSSFKYTSPNIIYSINKAIKMADNFDIKGILNDFEERLRLEIVNPKVMGWAASVLRIISTKKDVYYNNQNGHFLDKTIDVNCSFVNKNIGSKALTWKEYFNIFMLYMLAEHKCTKVGLSESEQKKNYHIDDDSVEWSFLPYKICFDGKQNNSYITYTYNQIIEAIEEISVKEESCGDMILSEYLILDGGDTIQDNAINTWHGMKFIQGMSETHTINKIRLLYIPTYL